MTYTVNQLAKLAGTSVRTLHYYDEIGLLKPSFIGNNGYRHYEEKELLKLQQILFFRELEFPLEEILQMVNSPKFDLSTSLRDQKKLLEMKKIRLDNLISTIEKTILKMKGNNNMKNDDLFNSFTFEQIEKYKQEAKNRWGNTNAYKQSTERTKNWTKEDYKRLAKEGAKFTQQLADTMEKGFASPEFQDLIVKHHKSIGVFYDCSLEMYQSLGEMYVLDARFASYYNKFKPELANVMRDAINYYVNKQKV